MLRAVVVPVVHFVVVHKQFAADGAAPAGDKLTPRGSCACSVKRKETDRERGEKRAHIK